MKVSLALLLALGFCISNISGLPLGAIHLPVEHKRSQPPPSSMTRREFKNLDIAPPKEMTRSEIPEMTRGEIPANSELREGDVIENDILLDKKLISILKESQAGTTKRGAIIGKNFRWPATTENGKRVVKIPYTLETSDVQAQLTRAIQAFNQKTCIRFVPRKDVPPSSKANYIRIYAGDYCLSQIGRQMGSQDLSLPSKCNHMGTIIHELMHALGFLHEQSRKDRDSYVTVNFDNMPKGNQAEYNKYDQDTQGIGFDYKSLLLYQTKTGSTNDKPTMIEKGNPSGSIELGNKNYFSAKDLKRVNKLYGCSEQHDNNQDYVVTVTTGKASGAGTNDYLYIDLIGANERESGFSSVGTGEGFDDFENGQVQTFNVVFKYVGAITKIKVRLGGNTWFAGWDLIKITVKDPITNTVYAFNYNGWVKDGETKTIAKS